MFKFENIKLFLFPLNPIKVFLNIRLMVILSFLLALRFVLQYLTIYIPVASMSISIAWTPLMLAGWIFGPVFGFFLGFITDTVAYLIKPGSIWYWMYAIQEPLVGMISGIIGFICMLRIKSVFNKEALENSNFKKPINKTYKLDLIIQQIFFIAFLIICVFALFAWLDGTQKFESKSGFDEIFFSYSKYIIVGALIFFFIAVEIISIFIYKKNKKNFILCCWVLILVILSSMIFSFILGPISAVSYYEYINGKPSSSFLTYGAIFYLIPRVIKESIKAPLQIVLFLLVLPIALNFITEIKNTIRLKWKTNLSYFDKFFQSLTKKTTKQQVDTIQIATYILIINNKRTFLHHAIDSNNGKILIAQIDQKETINSYYEFVCKLFSKYGTNKKLIFTGNLTYRFKLRIKNILFNDLKNHSIEVKMDDLFSHYIYAINSFNFTKNLYLYEFYESKKNKLEENQIKKIINTYTQSYASN